MWLKLEMMLLLYGVVGIHYPICSTWAVLPVSFCCTSSETELPTVSLEICSALMRLGTSVLRRVKLVPHFAMEFK